MDSVKGPDPVSEKAASGRAAPLDAAQFAALLDRWDQRIRAYILNRVRNPDTASDLTQEALAKAWESRATFDPAQDELAWLIAVTNSVISDYFKSLKAQKREPASGQKVPRSDGRFAIGPTLDAAVRPAVAPLTEIIDAEEIAALHAAIAKLDSSKRQAVEFRQAGLSYKEIANRLDVKNGTVGSLINRAVKELQELLQIKFNDRDGAPHRIQ